MTQEVVFSKKNELTQNRVYLSCKKALRRGMERQDISLVPLIVKFEEPYIALFLSEYEEKMVFQKYKLIEENRLQRESRKRKKRVFQRVLKIPVPKKQKGSEYFCSVCRIVFSDYEAHTWSKQHQVMIFSQKNFFLFQRIYKTFTSGGDLLWC